MKLRCRTRGRSRIAVMGLVLACGALALAAVAAIPALGASTVKVNSKITIVGDAGGAVFHGHVKSSRDACVKHRKVKLFKKRKGQDKLLGRDRTSRNGSWSIGNPSRNPLGAYQAKVKRSERDLDGTTLICRRATSRIVQSTRGRAAGVDSIAAT